MNNLFLDTETCGFHGPIVLAQYAIDDGPVHLYSPWDNKIETTLYLFEEFCNNCVIGFNLAFDWFHICQMYTTLELLAKSVGYDKYLKDYLQEYAMLESEARDGPCLKPTSAFDVMLHARKTEYQSTMDRRPIRIKRVPNALVDLLKEELEKRIKLKDIYFARKKIKADNWTIDQGEEFSDIVLRFKASSALKVLAKDALELKNDPLGSEVFPAGTPVEYGYAPFALAVGDGKAWPDIIRSHITHWGYNTLAREYATNDVIYTRELYKYFGSPPVGDDDSILACMVGAVRWKGFAIDIEGIKKLRDEALIVAGKAPKAPRQVMIYLKEYLSPTILAVMGGSTAKPILLTLLDILDDDGRAKVQAVIDARKATKEIENYDKLLKAGRFHASFKVIGTRSTRMSGDDDLNPQGINKSNRVRNKFPLASPPLVLMGGDFSAFEISIAAAVYNDPALTQQLCTCYKCGYVCSIEEFNLEKCPQCGTVDSKRKLHGLLAMEFFPGKSYEDILSSSGTDNDMYLKGKSGVFGALFGGDWNTWVRRLHIDEESAIKAYENWGRKYKGVGKFRESIKDKYCSMRQPGGIGTRVEWHEPAEYVETIFGFRRYFTLENEICRALFELANKLPEEWKNIQIKCVRRDREQRIGGAVMSALYAAAFNIQSTSMRAAANHLIQSAGATITKKLQVKLWELQPVGISDWQIQPMNIHDEIMAPALPSLTSKVNKIISDFCAEMREYVPLLKMDWSEYLQTWADK